jgi:hypothetical protein
VKGLKVRSPCPVCGFFRLDNCFALWVVAGRQEVERLEGGSQSIRAPARFTWIWMIPFSIRSDMLHIAGPLLKYLSVQLRFTRNLQVPKVINRLPDRRLKGRQYTIQQMSILRQDKAHK